VSTDDITIEAVVAAIMGLWTFLSLIVKLTPTKADDALLGRGRAWLERISFFQPKNSPGVMSLPGKAAARPLLYDRSAVEHEHERDGLP
jgi:hypothetical protein